MRLKDVAIAVAVGWMLRGHVERERQLRREGRELRRALAYFKTVAGR